MENQPKRRKLMTSRSGAGVVGSRVLINDVGFGGGGGGGGGRGLTRGAGAVAAVRGRTSPRPGGKVQPGKRVIANPLNIRQANHLPRATAPKGTQSKQRDQVDDRKDAKNPRGNCKGVGGAATRPAKREREIEEDAADAASGTSGSTKDQPGRVAVTRFRMAKNAGESKIPLAGMNRPSFLPKPKAHRKSTILAGCPRNLVLEEVSPSAKGGSPGPYTSTPHFDKLAVERTSSSPVDSLVREDVGKIVRVGKDKIGTLRYLGALEGEQGIWAGVELLGPGGSNDGTIRGRKYFSCDPKHGVMAPIREVRRVHLDENILPLDYALTNFITSDKGECEYTFSMPKANSTIVTGFGPCASLMLSGQASSGVIANSTFQLENNAQPDATFDLKGGTYISTGITPDTSFVAPDNEENRVVTNEKITNETRILDDKNKKNNRDLMHNTEKSKAEQETGTESFSPTTQMKGTKGSSRLVSPTKLGKLPTILPTKIVSPAKTSNGKVAIPEKPDVTQNVTFTMARGAANSPTRKVCKLNANSNNANDRGISTGKVPKQFLVENRCPEEVGVDNKKFMVNSTDNMAPISKPTGALFALNETFINEKPKNEANLPSLLSIPHLNLTPLCKTTYSSSKEKNESRNFAVKTFLTPKYTNIEEDFIDFSSPLQRRSNIQNRSLNLEDLLSSAESINAMSNSCLIENTFSPCSFPELTSIDDEDELTPPAAPPPSKATPAPHYLMLNKQNSFEHDESLGILTPDQMPDFTIALECSRTPSCENLTGSGGSRIVLTRASASRPSDLPTSVDGEPTEGSSERTPSPEELPLDPKPAEPTRVVPVSFITSITSITSLEAGYQGDGENSRPASRGADPPHVPQPPNLPAPRPDPMTDSDFFTESDADAHEEIVRGDRRAQVIDGTLFCAPGGRRCPSFTGEEMDSSGIYSDLERKQDEQLNEEAQSERQTPDTTDTVSQKSQPSPNKPEVAPIITDCIQVLPSTLDTSVGSNGSAATADLTIIEVVPSENSQPKATNKSDTLPLKKYKMPKRNVVSKIKAMIESGSKDETEKEGRRPQRSPRKGGRWDAVMSQIEAGKNEQRLRPARKEVKSRVLQSLSTPPSTTPRRSSGETNKSKSRRTRGRPDVSSPPTQETAHSSVHSSMSDLCSSPRSTKKRLGSPGGSDGPAHSTPRISSPRQQQPPSTLAINNNNVVPTGAANNNNHSNTAGNNHSQSRATPHSQRSPTAANPQRRSVNGRTNQQSRINNSEAKKNSLEVSRVNLEKSPSAARKPAVPRRSSSYVTPKQQNASPIKDRGVKESSPVTRGLAETRDQADQTDPTYEAFQLKHAEASVQALSVIVQYLAHQLDGFSAPKLKKDCERMKTEWMEARLEADELRAGHRRIEEQLNDQRDKHQRALDQMRNDLEMRHAEREAELETALQEERQSFQGRLEESLHNSAKEHQAVVARLRAEHEADLIRKEAETDRRSVVHDQGAALRAEVESLKTVLELRSQEITVLRSENENLRRDVEAKEAIEQKYDALEARCEDLKAQLQRKESFERQLSHENKVLLESFHHESKQKKRLSQHNEELQWRLRQNNEVVTVLANQLAAPPQRLSRSLGPEHIDHTQSPPASPMVKSMVEKSDSVSWTLEIEETPEAMASRLLRLSGSTRGISPSDSRPKRPRQPSTLPGAATVSRQSSLRTTPQRAVVLRARSKSVSVADSVPKEAWAPNFSSTPCVVRRRPRSDPAASPVVAVEANPGPRPQEAGGEAMISEETSASSSEDESSASSDNPRSAMEVSWSDGWLSCSGPLKAATL